MSKELLREVESNASWLDRHANIWYGETGEKFAACAATMRTLSARLTAALADGAGMEKGRENDLMFARVQNCLVKAISLDASKEHVQNALSILRGWHSNLPAAKAEPDAEAWKLACVMWEELNVPQGRNWNDHAVSKARVYWFERAQTALAFIAPKLAAAARAEALEEAAKVAEMIVEEQRLVERTDSRDIYTGEVDFKTFRVPRFRDGKLVAAALRQRAQEGAKDV